MRLASFLLGWIPTLLVAQMIPDAPIRDFRLPRFGEDGYKSWELRGVAGTYLNEDQVLVEGLDLLTFTGGLDLQVENRIRSPKALIDLSAETARGETSLFVTGPDFSIEGRDWIWSAGQESIIVRESVRVRIEDQIDILK